ncbi:MULTISPECIES: methyl-accepting chemotaxis protein [unclassified Halomonas]|uniref:methyl-accepting chemotaxis protein n=1 Tax=unclassified Halomonas TaxID=2609666 RepID=UPI0028839C38|nr:MULTISPECIES: methyl-accepting chemotaxis protein [unclassified Halomonas]MDT0500542.1 methyl-accepting chemotaxis protein [Halomonas sp. PAR7]MDT0511562.1 methyl-accepting chemotaxis protein [Halomonas sp. LES1]MDT0590150.1 methyl-accepting chemotaxis protein [Halomonas sp. PAR8]
MTRLTRNISLHTIMVGVLACLMLAVLAVAGMGFLASKQASDTMATLDQINIRQLNEINRADALLTGALLDLETASNHFMLGRRGEADNRLASALDQIGRAEERFEAFAAVPRTEEGSELGAKIEATFTEMLDLARQQHQALDQLNSSAFSVLRVQMVEPAKAQEAALTDFVHYADDRGSKLQAEYNRITEFYATLGASVLAIIALLSALIYLGLRGVVIRPLNHAIATLEGIAKADLTQEIQDHGRNEIGKLFAAMRDMQQSLIRIVGDVRDSSASIHLGTREIVSGNADLSSRTEQQAASLEETASSMEQITATVKQNADNARQASRLALDASNTAERGGDVVQQVVSTMHGISGSSRKIADITGVIDSIAFQTNILALNASVEAARAGEHGRGFAVVASEVRQLASRSADAAREIKALIDSSVGQVTQGSSLVEQAGTTMQEVVESVRRVTDIMDEISAASQEQSDGIEQVSQAVGQMDQVTQQNASLVQEAAAAAASLEEQASRLERAVAVFHLTRPASSGSSMPAAFPGPTDQGTPRDAAVITDGRHAAGSRSLQTTQTSLRRETPAAAEWEEF